MLVLGRVPASYVARSTATPCAGRPRTSCTGIWLCGSEWRMSPRVRERYWNIDDTFFLSVSHNESIKALLEYTY